MDIKDEHGRFHALDGLRGLAVLLVIANHLGPSEPPGHWWLYPLFWMSEIGWIGVDIFFVLSGFLITDILLTNRNASNYFVAFYAHRALRILPLYYGLLFLVFFVAPHVTPAVGNLNGQSKAYWLFYSNAWILRDLGFLSIYWVHVLGPTWSLAVEEQFYIVWSIAVRFISSTWLVFAAALAIPAGIALRCALLQWSQWNVPGYLSRIFFFGPTHLDGICVGALLCFALQRGMRDTMLRFGRLWWLFTAIVSVIFLSDHKIAPALPSNYAPIMLRAGLSAVAIAAAAVITNGLLINGRIRRLFNGRAISRIGDYSYCMYLFHWPIAVTIVWLFPSAKIVLGPVGLLIVETGATIAFAAASFRWFEQPIRALKRHFAFSHPGDLDLERHVLKAARSDIVTE